MMALDKWTNKLCVDKIQIR